MPKSDYQQRKAEGKCVRAGCKRAPRKNKDGSRRSYCDFHNEQNAKNSAAFIKRQKAKAGKPKLVRRRKVTPLPVTVEQKTA